MTGDVVDLHAAVARSARWSLSSSVFQRVAQVAVGIAIARLVVPEDVGTFAVALIAVAVALGVSELGAGLAVIRHRGDVDEIAPTATTVALVWSGTLTTGLVLAAGPLALAFGNPQATAPLRLLACTVLLGGISAVPAAVLQRRFEHRRVAVAELVGFAIGSALSLVLAATGAGAWSLVAGRVVTNAVVAAGLLLRASERVRPGLDLAALRAVLARGLPVTAASAVALAIWQLDDLVVSTGLGAGALGAYVIGFNLASWPVSALSAAVRSVSIPTFASLAARPERAGDALVRAVGLVAAVVIPAAVALGTMAEPLVRTVYGPPWSDAIIVLGWLAAVGAVRTLVDLTLDFVAATGRTLVVFGVQALWLAATVPALVIGVRLDGLRGVAAAQMIVAVGVALPAAALSVAHLGVATSRLLATLVRPAVGGLLGTGCALGARHLMRDDLASMALGGTAVVLCGAIVAPGTLRSGLRLARPLSLEDVEVTR